jgi:hypothetical protein
MGKTYITTAALLALSPLLRAQDSQKPSPAFPGEIVGPPLVAWSVVQQPHPIPATSPSSANGASDNRAQQSQPGQPTDSPQQPSAQTFTGTIAKDGGAYILKVTESVTYQLGEDGKAKSYEGKQVRIAGKLDAKNNVLYITNIELLS